MKSPNGRNSAHGLRPVQRRVIVSGVILRLPKPPDLRTPTGLHSTLTLRGSYALRRFEANR
jgi:hypothetical protein